MPRKRIATDPVIQLKTRRIGLSYPTYFIADIAANHDGSLVKAKHLISLAKAAGADAAKFQHFRAEKIVSRHGFESMKRRVSHQAKLGGNVFEVYQAASVPWEWTKEIKAHCRREQVDFLSAPYDLETIDMLDAHMDMYKIGSGDITWTDALVAIAKKNKPVFLSTGASTLSDVSAAVRIITRINPRLCLMQCNTNYTGSIDNFRHIQLKVLITYARTFPDLVLGLSDHTPEHSTVLGAVTLGARVIEKHFTDNRSNEGPDHSFSMDPRDWRDMVERTRELELALGGETKKVEENEQETVLIQRRCLRAARALGKGERLRREDIDVLRPVKPGAFLPGDINRVVGRKIMASIPYGEALEPWMFRKP